MFEKKLLNSSGNQSNDHPVALITFGRKNSRFLFAPINNVDGLSRGLFYHIFKRIDNLRDKQLRNDDGKNIQLNSAENFSTIARVCLISLNNTMSEYLYEMYHKLMNWKFAKIFFFHFHNYEESGHLYLA